MKIYVASSWRNHRQPAIVQLLRDAGHEVYDFRHPLEDDSGFSWYDVDPLWRDWSTADFIKGLQHPLADKGYGLDKAALDWCEVCVLVMPCGRSAHLELGYAAGRGKTTIIFLADDEPELMYKLADRLAFTPQQLLEAVAA